MALVSTGCAISLCRPYRESRSAQAVRNVATPSFRPPHSSCSPPGVSRMPHPTGAPSFRLSGAIAPISPSPSGDGRTRRIWNCRSWRETTGKSHGAAPSYRPRSRLSILSAILPATNRQPHHSTNSPGSLSSSSHSSSCSLIARPASSRRLANSSPKLTCT